MYRSEIYKLGFSKLSKIFNNTRIKRNLMDSQTVFYIITHMKLILICIVLLKFWFIVFVKFDHDKMCYI